MGGLAPATKLAAAPAPGRLGRLLTPGTFQRTLARASVGYSELLVWLVLRA